ncbi:hypothetical protein O6H91_01G087700 [Diphasiastrum complanatum]|uniref:Uncharacterized protein n=1 Tax=Diphasiastrum complanatum TaxID=34168 RepID=A0ACC2ET93_DIPCM|nr:hypothetical protein O6H91_01G087700 [Diphasiastrum complanatum]
MGQISSRDRDNRQLQRIIDHAFEYFTAHNGKDYLTFQELYTAILLVYNDVNKYFPGPHYDPPTREQVQEMLKTFDTNQNGLLDRSEFNLFVKKFTANVASRISKNILIFSILAPGLAVFTKRATEKVPGVGPVVCKVPSAVYASLITTVIAVVGKVNGNS